MVLGVELWPALHIVAVESVQIDANGYLKVLNLKWRTEGRRSDVHMHTLGIYPRLPPPLHDAVILPFQLQPILRSVHEVSVHWATIRTGTLRSEISGIGDCNFITSKSTACSSHLYA